MAAEEDEDNREKLKKLFDMDFQQMLTRFEELSDVVEAQRCREALRGVRTLFMLALQEERK